jgi:hypothetical protein
MDSSRPCREEPPPFPVSVFSNHIYLVDEKYVESKDNVKLDCPWFKGPIKLRKRMLKLLLKVLKLLKKNEF